MKETESCNCHCGCRWGIFPAGVFSVLIVLLLFSKFGSFPLSITSTVTQKTDLFTAGGEGKVLAKPDTAEVTIGLEKSGSSITSLQNEVNTATNKLVADLKKLGVEEKYIRTASYNLSPNYDWSTGRQRITGYTLSVRLAVKTKNLDKINEVIDTATIDGANQIYGLNLTVDEEKMRELQKQAREIAIKEAKQKAEELARPAGIHLGKIINVSENLTTPWEPRPLYNLEKAPAAGGAPTEIQPGEAEVRVQVTLSYQVL
jgi:uncharacterized protein YggE